MTSLTPAEVTKTLDARYAAKQFDPARSIPAETWAALEHALVTAPSSFGLQPWRFHVITAPELKARLRAASWGQAQVTECSHYVVFTVRKGIDEAHIDKFLARHIELRGGTLESLAGYRGMMAGFVKNLTASGQLDAWSARQVYIALGQYMSAAAFLGIDTCPMEGIDATAYDEILGLGGTAFATVVGCATGYRVANDKYAGAAKVRFPVSELVTYA